MSVVKLPQFGDEYAGHSMRELVRQVEFALNELNRAISGAITVVNPSPGDPTPDPGGSPSSVVLSNEDPEDLGIAHPGTSTAVSRGDHVHNLPSASDVGADPEGTAAAAIADHESAEDPHPQYIQDDDLVPYSLNKIDVGDEVSIPRNANLVIYDHFDCRGSLDLRGSLCDTSPDINSVGYVSSVVAGTGMSVDSSDASNPIVALDADTQTAVALAESAIQIGDAINIRTSESDADKVVKTRADGMIDETFIIPVLQSVNNDIFIPSDRVLCFIGSLGLSGTGDVQGDGDVVEID